MLIEKLEDFNALKEYHGVKISRVNKIIDFTDCNYNKEITIKNLTGYSLICLNTKRKDLRITILGGQYNTIKLHSGNNLKIEKTTSINTLAIANTIINLQKVQNIKLVFITNATINISDTKIEKCKLSIPVHRIKLNNVDITIFKINNTRQIHCHMEINNLLLFESIKSSFESSTITLNTTNNSIISLINTDFSKDSKLLNCDFSKCDLLAIQSNIESIKTENIKWFKKIKSFKNPYAHKIRITNITDSTQKLHKLFKGKKASKYKLIPPSLTTNRETARQLKVAMNNSNNFIDFEYFKAKELQAHLKEIDFFSKRFNSKIVLFLNRISNNFEQSWFLPLIWILIGGYIFFLMYLNSTIIERSSLLELNCNYWNYFPKFLLPTHSFNFIDEKINYAGDYTYTFDVLHRIFNGYFIYQFVAAFRKFRKS